MSEQRPTVSVRYYLNLEESQDGFALVTFGKKTFSRFLTPVISIAIIGWGIYLGFSDVGRYYVALGAFFLIMQGLMLGKPIVAAVNAADPRDSWRIKMNMGNEIGERCPSSLASWCAARRHSAASS